MEDKMKPDNLFKKGKLGRYQLPHRVVMAPLTRCRAAQPGDVPQQINVKYYQQRASAALIITEASQISPQGKGYAYTPGIYSPEQINGWRKIVDSVHAEGSHIFIQLWHVGRVSHSSLQPDNTLPVAPSAIAVNGKAFTESGKFAFETPRALKTSEIPAIIQQYRQAAINAKQAGFDGIEIHAANGYLLDQFLKDGSNHRQDQYGGSIANRARLTIEVIKAVTEVWGGDSVGIRFSPTGTSNSMSESDPQSLYNYLIEQLNPYNLAYIHLIEDFNTQTALHFDFKELKKRFNGAYIANGAYDAKSAEQSITNDWSDFVAFGVPFIANPDLPLRLKTGAQLTDADPATYYGNGNGNGNKEKGYTDYPFLQD